MSRKCHNWVWVALANGDADVVQKAPLEFDVHDVHPTYGTAFTAPLDKFMRWTGGFSKNPKAMEQCINELVGRGARLDACVPDSCKAKLSVTHFMTSPVAGKTKDEVQEFTKRQISIAYAGKPLIEILLEMRATIETQQEEFAELDDVWSSRFTPWRECLEPVNELITRVLNLMPMHHKVPRVSVPEAVVDLWERVLASPDCADLQIQSRSGETLQRVHSAVFMEISPVTRAMLSSGMSEGQKKAVQVDDDSGAVRLFFSMVYSGCLPPSDENEGQCQSTAEVTDAVGALDISTRWVAEGFTSALAERLRLMITEKTFEIIFDAALRHQLMTLRDGCVDFARQSPAVKEALHAGQFQNDAVVQQLQKLFGSPGLASCRRKRRAL